MKIIIELLLLLTAVFPLFHMVDALFGIRHIKKKESVERGFSILIPCYNESICVDKSIDTILKSSYKNYEVFYINDGSIDDTFIKLCRVLKLKLVRNYYVYEYYQSELYPNFYCISKPNSGKGESLNVAINHCSKEVIITLDADSMLNKDCLNIMNDAFADKNVVAAGGAVHIMQAKDKDYYNKLSKFKKLIIGAQAVEYLKGFFIYKLSLAKQNALAIISGAFGAFRKDILVKVNGFRKSLGEDIDVTIKIQKHITGTKKKVVFVPNAGCYTECPENIKDLFKQRVRWQKGFIDCILYHAGFLFRSIFINPLSFYILVEAFFVAFFSYLLPVVSILSLLFMYSITIIRFLIFFGLFAFVFHVFYSITAIIVSHRTGYPYEKIFLVSIFFEIFFLRFFYMFIYLFGTFTFTANSSSWNKVQRSPSLSKGEKEV